MESFQAQYIPSQSDPVAEQQLEGMALKALISCYPPLGQVTVSQSNPARFVLFLAVDKTLSKEPWEVSLWYSTGEDWQEHQLKQYQSLDIGGTISIGQPALDDLKFHGEVPLTGSIDFTIKFRKGGCENWEWAKDHQGMKDGTVVLKQNSSSLSIGDDLGQYVEGLNPALKAEKRSSQSPGTSLWSVTTSVEGAVESKSTFLDVKFGLPWGGIKRWFGLVRLWSPWLAPRQGQSPFKLDKEAVMCSFLSPVGKHMVLLAISGVEDVMTLITNDHEGNVNLHIRNDSATSSLARVIVTIGDDFESANAAAMYHARGIVREEKPMTGQAQEEMKTLIDDVKPQWMENWYEGLTYCTWNGLGQKLTEDKVLEAVDALAAANIDITNLIIDDNWQALDYRGHGQFQHGWMEFEAERKMFPSGLKEIVSQIRSKHKNIQHIAVWHAILGYWGGIAPDGRLAKDYKTIETEREDALRRNLPLGGKMTVIAKEDVPRFYDDFYKFLSSCGIDAVKTDAQFMLDTIISAKDRRELIDTYLDAWTISSMRYFSIKAISCMSQTPQILFHSQLPTNKPAVLVRNSDDFFPEIPDSHPWHIFCNAHNSLLTQHLNILPDWDMFQTVHDYSGFHAAARCVSGGPIYITDVPGQHNIKLIKEMTAKTTRGKTVILRPSTIGKSMDQYAGYDDNVLLKVGTYHGMAASGTGILGIFNISKRSLSELVHVSRFPGTLDSAKYVVRSHRTGSVSRALEAGNPRALVSVWLDTRGYDVVTAHPLRSLTSSLALSGSAGAATVDVANLGLLGKMTGAAAIVNFSAEVDGAGKIKLETSLKALGVLGIYVSDLSSRRIVDSFLVLIQNKVIPVETVSSNENDEHVVDIDLEKAWKDMGLSSGWSNEIDVVIYINPA